MAFENIILEKKNSIAYVTVNRPKVLNALNMATMEELRAAFHDIKNDKNMRVVIFTGAGEKAFIAGADISELAKHDAVSGKEYTHRGQSVLNLIENLGKPVIACIHGFALGGGCEIAMACTMRLASENAKLGQPEVKLGIIPGYGGTQRLPRLVGKGIAMQMVLAGEMITAQEAHRIGLVNEIVPAAELVARAEAIAAERGDWELARQQFMESVRRFQSAGYERGVAFAHNNFGRAALDHGNFLLAADLLQQAASSARKAADPDLFALATMNSAEALAGTGEAARAESLANEALTHFTATGNGWRRVECERLLGDLAMQNDRAEAARSWWSSALVTAQKIGAQLEVSKLEERLRSPL